ncbi:M2 family metallopeptidase [Pseudofulvimonas gallinarii]|jgi:peptidyl-dipeptidase A|uniref:Peptidyl-dipeptidase A n=1 Tax=Pseudofulvimonas gallinarii TaxID=634155 RepID=A0A4R3LRE9_9GAMM|nr:M2 family metallopeptidase [Pseudofulvimonas gallinarii]TCT00707.1 peptidyl-dipeptidase A [Pseudofulvimonas gallinarii]
MTRTLLLPALIAVALSGPAQSGSADAGNRGGASAKSVDAAAARDFVARINDEYRASYPELSSAQWIASTYINGDSQLVAAKANERNLAWLNQTNEAAKVFASVPGIDAASARTLGLLKLQTAMPAPSDAARRSELAAIAARMEALYGSGKHCGDPGNEATCRDLGELSDVLYKDRDWDAQLDAWRGWHTISRPMRRDYVRFVELVNEGSRELGFANGGEMWRAGYDMSPAEFEAETDRLWDQVKPLYESLHCHVRHALGTRYGDRMPEDGTIPAHVTGNMWAQDWSALYPLVEPYPGVTSLDVDAAIEASGMDATAMTRRAEDFYTSLGMPALPASFYQRSQFTKPADREVVCHASAWDMDMQGDVRIKMCIKPNEEEFRTIYHELGHIYYYLAYNALPPLFQNGAHDGFHEAIGDTVMLSLTPSYLSSIGLVPAAAENPQATLNEQMKLALEKVVFLPFGKLIDQWRWAVFDGRIKPERYNDGWWQLRRQYQGISAEGRTEEDFDPGAKYHVPGNTPYTRYFLAHILQFQFHKALCDAAGHTGPLHTCSVYGNKAAGEKFWAMLQRGNSQPWQLTLRELTGTGQMDASAILDYFAPLKTWLDEQNAGRDCGWR